MPTEPNTFYLRVAFALTGCQLVEEELKLYITGAFELAKKCIGPRMPFKLSGADYEDASLERLIDIFRKFSDNDELIKDLRKFKDERNYLGHKSIAHCLDPFEDLTELATTDALPRIEAIQIEARRLRLAIHGEGNVNLVHLRFESFPD